MSQSALSKQLLTSPTTICGLASVQCFGIHGGHNWVIDRSRPETFGKIFRVLPEGIDRVWMPIPSYSNAEIAPSFAFSEEATQRGTTIMGKCCADGAALQSGEAFAIVSADCPTVVVYNKDKTHTVCFHASRDSLFDREFLLNHSRSRKRFSVVGNALAVFTNSSIPLQDVRMHIFCGIRTGFTHPPSDPNHGKYNRALLEQCRSYDHSILDSDCGEIDLHAVIREQAVEEGVLSKNIFYDGIDTRDQKYDGEYCWASTRRDLEKRRNLVLVHRH